MSAPVSADVYTDFQSLTKLRGQAQQQSPEARAEVARQFESMLVQMMLKSMRAASSGEDIMGSQQTEMYREMYDQQIALHMGKRGLGLAPVIERQLAGPEAAAQSTAEQPAAMPLNQALPRYNGINYYRDALATDASDSEATAQQLFPDLPPLVNRAPQAPYRQGSNGPIRSPEDFVRELWPQAQAAAADLGVSPKFLLAQAALETGWGKSVIRNADGSSSHNLFGIKAHGGWQGERVSVPTLEYEDGVAVKRKDAFRAYGSYAESFQDYVNFLRQNPRYREALTQTDHPQAFASALQRAGYATDPAYARKIGQIINGDTLGNALAQLNSLYGEPLT